jgi:hypothetical protein
MRRFSIGTACSVALLLGCVSVLSASDTTFVHQGAWVKVFPAMAGAEPLIGEVVKLAYDTLVIVPKGNGSAQTFYSSDLRKIEVSQGTKSEWLRGGWIGAASGSVAGALIGAVSCNDPKRWLSCSNPGGAALILGALGGAVGFGMGAGVGALIKTERWDGAQLPQPPPVALNVGQDGSVRLAFSLRL